MEDGAVEVSDPVSARRFRFETLEAEVLQAFDGRRSASEIAIDLLGDDSEAGQVADFAARLDELCLVDGHDDSDGALASKQAYAFRPDARRKRDQRVAESVRWAATHVPFHRDRLAGLVDDVHGVKDLARLPTMSKRDFRDNFPARLLPAGLELADLVARGEAQIASTSGSTGGRLEFIRDSNRDFLLRRFPGAHAVHGGWDGARMARFTTPICSGAICHMGGVPYEERVVDGILHLNSSQRVLRLKRAEVQELLADLERFGPNVFQVDPVYAVALVRALERFGLPVPRFSAVLSFFEFCSIVHRPILADAFQAPVTDFLSAADLGGGVAAFACERGRFHVNDRENVIELLRAGRPVEPGQTGEIAVTTLNHRFTRLIRYLLGDLGTAVEHCGCAFDDLPAFVFEGRVQDCLVATTGEPVTTRAVDALFEGLNWLDFYQLVQHAPRQLELIAVRRPGTEEGNDAKAFIDRARGLLGADAEIRIEHARELPVEPSFKYPLTKRLVPASWKAWH